MTEDNRVASTGRPTRRPAVPLDQHSSRSRRLVSLVDAAEVLGMSVASIRRLVWDGKLHIVKLNRRVLVDLRDIERLIEEAKDRRSW